jgi:predicted nucleic acid-binding Zn ribbon protein
VLCRRKDSNLHEGLPRRILNPLRLPFRHFGAKLWERAVASLLSLVNEPEAGSLSSGSAAARIEVEILAQGWANMLRVTDSRPPAPKGDPSAIGSARAAPNSDRPAREALASWIPAPPKAGARGLTPLGQVLVRTHEAMHKRSGALLTAEEWKSIVGERIAARTRVQNIFKGNLVVNVASSAWALELSFLSADIVARLVASGREISGLKFRVEPLLEPTPSSRPRRMPRPSENEAPRPGVLPDDLVARLALVEDPQLRGAIAEAAMKSLIGAQRASQNAASPPRSPESRLPSAKKTERRGF